MNKLILCLFLSLMIFLSLRAPSIAQKEKGYWKLVNVSHKSQIKSVSEKLSDVTFTAEGKSGNVIIKVKGKTEGKPFEVEGNSAWNPPPAKAEGGQFWITGGSGSISKGKFTCFTNPLFSSDSGGFSENRVRFAFIEGSPGKRMKIWVEARIQCQNPDFHVSDRYVYSYEWIKE